MTSSTDSIRYKGETFRRRNGKYFYSDKHKVGDESRALHRRIWEDAYGPIPPNHVIHHLDGDIDNNDLDNLSIMNGSVHREYHMLKDLRNDRIYEERLKALQKAQEAAKEWHRSEEGKKFHAELGRKSWDNKKKQPCLQPCKECGADYETFFPTRTKFCSRACQRADSNRRWRKVKRYGGDCVMCGKTFKTGNPEQKTCSRSCGMKNRHAEKFFEEVL